jgi:hypothetical protein
MTGLTLAEKASRSSRSQFCPSEPPPLWKQTALPLSSRPGEVMGLRPTQGDEKRLSFSNYSPLEARRSPLSSRPERTRISYFALLATSTCAALRTESRMQILNATGLHRKSGGAQWRDLRSFLGNDFRQSEKRSGSAGRTQRCTLAIAAAVTPPYPCSTIWAALSR